MAAQIHTDINEFLNHHNHLHTMPLLNPKQGVLLHWCIGVTRTFQSSTSKCTSEGRTSEESRLRTSDSLTQTAQQRQTTPRGFNNISRASPQKIQ